MTIYQPRHMLVTGGAGFIGANFIQHVLAQNAPIHLVNLDKLTYAGSLSHLEHLPHAERYHFIQGDITDAALVQHLLRHHRIDTIVHFAAESHVDRSIASPLTFVETNVVGTAVLLEAARHVWFEENALPAAQCRFHHVSTDEVFGSLGLDSPACTDTTAYQPRSPYSASKAGSDHLALAYYHTYGLPVTLSNCSNNYGPYQHDEKFIPTIIRCCLQAKRIPIYGQGNNCRDWLYVDDHCQAITAILRSGNIGQRYTIGANNEWDNNALAHYLCEQMYRLFPAASPYTTLLDHVTDRPGHDFRYAVSTEKIQTELGWSPCTSFEAGLRKTIEFYRMRYTQ